MTINTRLKMSSFKFNPDQVAYYEVAGWKAYYDHAWVKLLRLVVALVQEQFHIPFPISLLAAYYTTRASVAWVPVDHDLNVVGDYLEKFYRVARRYSGLEFDPAHAAELELKYWVVHRELSGKPEKTAFVEAMIELHSVIFGISQQQAKTSGEERVQANIILDTITGRTSQDPDGDWLKCEEHLRHCYRSIQQAIQ
jgi:hypothetical protein